MSGITTGTALLVGGLAGAGGSIASGIMGSNAANNAANTQANAAEQAAQLQYQASQNALDFQKQQWQTEQNNLAPWLGAGENSLSNLQYLMGLGPGGQQSSPYPSSPNVNPGGPSMPTAQGGSGLNVRGGPLMPSGASSDAMGMTGLNPGAVQGSPAMPSSGAQRMTGLNPGAMQSGALSPSSGVQPMTGMNPGAAQGSAPNTSLGGFGSLMAANPYSNFSSPTEAQMVANDPGYQARWNLAQRAMDNSAAARGNVLTGGTVQAENQAAQDYASNEYNNYYNQSFNNNAQNYNAFAQNQANQFNRLAAISGVGQTAANTLGTLGTEMSGQVGSNLLNTAQAMGQQYNNAAAANASGIIGGSNALGAGIQGATGSLSNLLLMKQLLGSGATSSTSGGWGG